MTINVSWTITCDNWLDEEEFKCRVKCHAYHDGDNFRPHEDGWVSVEYGNGEDEGEHYCPVCAEKLGKVDEYA